MGSSPGGCKDFFLENNDEFFNHFGRRFEIRTPTENLKMCYLDIIKRKIRTHWSNLVPSDSLGKNA